MPIFASSVTSETKKELMPLLDFRRNDTIDLIDRLDDAIMGGISTSTVRQGTNYAIWSGVCRTDGGGFCGFRTNPFRTPLLLNATETKHDGFYAKCRLASDNEADRRVWKLTTRTKPDRGELLYQAPIQLDPAVAFDDSLTAEVKLPDWQTVYVPFDSFRLVRGPRIIENGAPLNISQGIYQIGMSMSKFLFAASSNSTEKTLDNFRDGYFELHIEEIGVYATNSARKVNSDGPDLISASAESLQPLSVFSKVEVKQQRPLLVKFLFFVSKIFFSEKSQRRKSAFRKLQSKWNMSRGQAIWWGLKRRVVVSTIKPKSYGLFRKTLSSARETLSILAIDSFRFVLTATLKFFLFYPIQILVKVLRVFSRAFTKAPRTI